MGNTFLDIGFDFSFGACNCDVESFFRDADLASEVKYLRQICVEGGQN
jgi:hypothetical protein